MLHPDSQKLKVLNDCFDGILRFPHEYLKIIGIVRMNFIVANKDVMVDFQTAQNEKEILFLEPLQYL